MIFLDFFSNIVYNVFIVKKNSNNSYLILILKFK